MKRDLPFNVDDAELQAVLARRVAAAIELLWDITREFNPAALASSLGAEDMVLTDLIAKHAPTIEIFTLDTGRLHAETHRLLQQAMDHYDLRIRVVYPDGEALERLVAENGINGFFNSVANRKACCEVRKVEPLRRALAGKRAWITGLRRAQSPTRARLPLQEHDTTNGLEKFNPLSDWQEQDVWAYLHVFGVPYNALHDRGFPSIGCEPCTRAVTPGEDLRAGRWWWEEPDGKECGLHPAKRAQAAG
ncbi:MAG: phosphoadenylyl-sulfate reductase [Burkholderiales bacterium]